MSSEFKDDIKYLSVDPLNRRRYWRSGSSARLSRANTKPGMFASGRRMRQISVGMQPEIKPEVGIC